MAIPSKGIIWTTSLQNIYLDPIRTIFMRDPKYFLSVIGLCVVFLVGIIQPQSDLESKESSSKPVKKINSTQTSPSISGAFDPTSFRGLIAYNETFDTQIAGQEPIGWTVLDEPSVGSVVQVTSEGPFSTNCLNMSDRQSSARVEANVTLPVNATDGSFEFDFSCVVPNSDDVSYWVSLQNQSFSNILSIGFNYMAAGSTWNISINDQYGTTQFLPSPSIYHLTLVFNASITNLFVNETLEVANIPYSRQVLTQLSFISGLSYANGSAYFDNLFLARAPIVLYEDFNDDTVGEHPAGWNCWDDTSQFMECRVHTEIFPTPHLSVIDHQNGETAGGWVPFDYPIMNGTIEFDVAKAPYLPGPDDVVFWVKLQTTGGSDVVVIGVHQQSFLEWWNMTVMGVSNNTALMGTNQFWHIKVIMCNGFIDVFANGMQIFTQVPYAMEDMGRLWVQSDDPAYGDSCYFDNFYVVDNSTLHMNHPIDFDYIYGEESPSILWTICPAITNNCNYTIFNNGTIIQTGSWDPSCPINFDVHHYLPGSYNFSIIAIDSLGQSVSDEVIVTIEKNPKILWIPGNSLLYDDFNDDILEQTPEGWIVSDSLPNTQFRVNLNSPLLTPHLTIKDSSATEKFSGELDFINEIDEGSVHFNIIVVADGPDTTSYRLYLKNAFNFILINVTLVLRSSGSNWSVILDNNTLPNTYALAPTIIKFDLYFQGDTINLFLDDMRVTTLFRSTHNFRKLTLESETSALGPTVYLDDLRVSVPPLTLRADFENDTIGNYPNGWTSSEASNTDISVTYPGYFSSNCVLLSDDSTTNVASSSYDLPYGISRGIFEMNVALDSHAGAPSEIFFYLDLENATGSDVLHFIFRYYYGMWVLTINNAGFPLLSCDRNINISVYFEENNAQSFVYLYQNAAVPMPVGYNNITRINFYTGAPDYGLSMYYDNVKIYDLASEARIFSPPAEVNHVIGVNESLDWWIIDSASINQTYQLFLNGTIVQQGSWHPIRNITYNLMELPGGSFNLTLYASEDCGGWIFSSTIVQVINDAPLIPSPPLDFSYSMGSVNENLTWTILDLTTLNPTFSVFCNGSQWGTYVNSPWITGIPNNISIVGLIQGFYNFTILALDGGGLNISDEVIIEVTNAPPNLPSPPPDLQYEWESGNFNITWLITDSTTLNPIYSIYCNESLWSTYVNQLWSSGVEFNVSLSGLLPGFYNFTIIASDGGYSVRDEVIVTVTNAPPTNPVPPEDLTYAMGSTGNNLSWEIIDVSTQSPTYSIYIDGVIWGTCENLPWTSGNSIEVSFDDLKNGTYLFSIEFSDGVGGFLTDNVTVVVTNVLPTIIHPTNPTILYNTVGNIFKWAIQDYTILQPTYAIYVNGNFYRNDTWIPNMYIYVSLDSLEIGTYFFEIYVNDGSGTLVHDAITVTVEDVPEGFPLPMIVLGLIAAILVPSMIFFYYKKKRNAHRGYL